MEAQFKKFISSVTEEELAGVAKGEEDIAWSPVGSDFYFWAHGQRELREDGDIVFFDSEGMADVLKPLGQIKQELLADAAFHAENICHLTS